MTEFSCKFHPERNGVFLCEQCGSLFCSECRKENQVYHGPSGKINPESENLCPLCYKYSLLENIKRNKIAVWVIAAMLMLFVVFLIGVMQVQLILIPLLLFAMIFLLIAKAIGSFQTELELIELEISQIPSKIMESVADARESKLKPPITDKEVKRESLFCQQCGSKMDINAAFCPNCGEPTDDEHSMLFN